jgi:hypothetical protein
MSFERNCTTCTHFRDDSDGDEFPYQNAPDCAEVDFRRISFADNVDDTQGSEDDAFKRYKAYIDEGIPL